MDIIITQPIYTTLIFVAIAAVGFIAAIKPERGFTAVIFLTPFYILRVRNLSIPTNGLELLIIAAVIGWAFYCLRNKKMFFTADIKILALSGFIIAGGVLSALASEPALRLPSLAIFRAFIFEPIIFALALQAAIKQKIFSSSSIIRAYVFSASFVALLSLAGALLNHFNNSLFEGFLTYDGRLKGFYLSPNHLAMYLAPAVPLVIAQAVSRLMSARDPSTRISRSGKGFLTLMTLAGLPLADIFLASIILSALFLTKSFGAIAATAIGLWFFATIYFKNRRKLWLEVSAVLVLPLLFLVAKEAQVLFVDPERSSLASRLMIWRSALTILRDHHIFGIGPGNFQEYYLAYQKYFSPYLEWAVPQPHNLLLALWLQTGILGVIGFVWLIFNRFKKLVNRLKSDLNQSDKIITAAVVSAVVIILMHGLVDTTIWKNDLATMFFVLLNL